MKLSQRGLGVADWLGVNEPQVVLRHSLRLRVQAFICLSAVQGDHVAIRVSIVFRRVGSIGKPKLCKSAVRPPVCETAASRPGQSTRLRCTAKRMSHERAKEHSRLHLCPMSQDTR